MSLKGNRMFLPPKIPKKASCSILFPKFGDTYDFKISKSKKKKKVAVNNSREDKWCQD